MTLFDPILAGPTQPSRLSQIDTQFIQVHGALFYLAVLENGKFLPLLAKAAGSYHTSLDGHIGRTTRRWLELGYHQAISDCCALFGYGAEENPLTAAIRTDHSEDHSNSEREGGDTTSVSPAKQAFDLALSFVAQTASIVLQRLRDPNVLPYIHVMLVCLLFLSDHPGAMAYLEGKFPFRLLSLHLNTLLSKGGPFPLPEGPTFPRPDKGDAPRPLPEDHALRGLTFAEGYHPSDWFSNDKTDEEERYFELPSMVDERIRRISFIGRCIAEKGRWLMYDGGTRHFSAPLDEISASHGADGPESTGIAGGTNPPTPSTLSMTEESQGDDELLPDAPNYSE